ncbi:MAG: hypothetical protein LJE68_00490, partial [Rhodobacter sp.]|nr:hypothetical protein [Rhodobacter sp.]
MHAVIQGQSHGHAHAHGHMHGPSRGERLVARHDQNDDGKLGIDELADTRLGRRMSVARFARIDTDGDAMLSAAELDNVKRGRGGAAMKEAAMRARYADYLVQQVENTKAETDIATRV